MLRGEPWPGGAPAAAADLFEPPLRLTPPGRDADADAGPLTPMSCIFQCGDSHRARDMLEELVRTTERTVGRAPSCGSC